MHSFLPRLFSVLLVLLVGWAMLPTSVAASTTAILPVAADVELRSAQPATNLGDELDMYVGNSNASISRIAIQAPLDSLPPNVVIDSAVLQFSVSGWGDFANQVRPITASLITALWDEHTATWQNQPSFAEVIGTVNVGTPQQPSFYGLNVTTAAQRWYAGTASNYGLMLTFLESKKDVYRIIASRETTAAPRLSVTYHESGQPSPSATPTQTPSQTPTATRTGTPTQTPSQTPTATPTQTPSQTPTATRTGTPTQTPSQTLTATPTQTPSQTPTGTLPTQTPTGTPTETPSQTPTGTLPTQTSTATPTRPASPGLDNRIYLPYVAR